jgi:hypothetical protein
MIVRLIQWSLLLSITCSAFSQPNPLIVKPGINLPKDSILSTQFMASFNQFLQGKDKPDPENKGVWKKDSGETLLLRNQMRGVEKNLPLKDSNFYKPYLTNVVKLNDSTYSVQIAYLGVQETTPVFRAGFNLLAHRVKEQFYFSSPLKRNAATWQAKKLDNYTFYYKRRLNKEKAMEYTKTVSFFDKKLKAPPQQMDIYCCDDFPEVMKMVGIEYYLPYNGFNANTNLSWGADQQKVLVNASEGGSFNHFDPHDLWHERLHRVVSTDSINKAVDEGCAFLYGGSWGMTWKEILEKFNTKLGYKADADWLKLYEEQFDFGDSEAKRLRTNYFLNALIVQKLEKERGFAAVLTLLTCGKYEAGNERYFKVLETLTGINKLNFNAAITKLVHENR